MRSGLYKKILDEKKYKNTCMSGDVTKKMAKTPFIL